MEVEQSALPGLGGTGKWGVGSSLPCAPRAASGSPGPHGAAGPVGWCTALREESWPRHQAFITRVGASSWEAGADAGETRRGPDLGMVMGSACLGWEARAGECVAGSRTSPLPPGETW